MKPDTPLNPPVAVGYVRVSTEEQAHEGVSRVRGMLCRRSEEVTIQHVVVPAVVLAEA